MPTCRLGTWCNETPSKISDDLTATLLLITCQIGNRSPWGNKLLIESWRSRSDVTQIGTSFSFICVSEMYRLRKLSHPGSTVKNFISYSYNISLSLFLLTLTGKFSFLPGLGYIGTWIFLLEFSHLGWEKGYKSVKARTHCCPLEARIHGSLLPNIWKGWLKLICNCIKSAESILKASSATTGYFCR